MSYPSYERKYTEEKIKSVNDPNPLKDVPPKKLESVLHELIDQKGFDNDAYGKCVCMNGNKKCYGYALWNAYTYDFLRDNDINVRGAQDLFALWDKLDDFNELTLHYGKTNLLCTK